MAYLHVIGVGDKSFRKRIEQSAVIGRAAECDCWVDDARMSRRHCKIERVHGQWVLSDLGSTNGTFSHGMRITQQVLRDGEGFEAGDTRIVFHADDLVPGARPADPSEAARLAHLTASQETIVAAPAKRPLPRVPHVEPLAPAAQAHAGGEAQSIENKPPPLAFSRPPAAPIVDEQIDSGGSLRSWLTSLLSRHRRK